MTLGGGPTLECARHGRYLKPYNAKTDICPESIEDAAAAEKRFFSPYSVEV
jgi:hypothetical protein